jgi:hypothetical protein
LFTGVGAVTTSGPGKGSCTALSQNWILTAAHVVSGAGSVTTYFTVEGLKYSYTTSQIYVYNFEGNTYNASTHDYDVALVYIPDGILATIATYSLYTGTLSTTTHAHNGTQLTIVGYGGSGYGDIGYSASYPLGTTVRRVGGNVVDVMTSLNGVTDCLFYQMDFDDNSAVGTVGGSLGNDIETTLCTGDSGGPA